MKQGCGIGLGIVIAILGGAILIGLLAGDGDSEDSDDQRASACKGAEEFVERQLKAPGTAEFQGCGERSISSYGSEWTVAGWVDAENSFGAKLRNDYRVVMNDEGDEWRLRDISLTPR